MFVSPYMPFPNILWWSFLIEHNAVLLDGYEHYEKMSYRNKFFIAGPNDVINLSIPLDGGRGQRTIMQNVCLDNRQNWQKIHWKTLESVYNRSPYFQYYKDTLQPLFTKQYKLLIDFNTDTIKWVAKCLQVSLEINKTESYIGTYSDMPDIRDNCKPCIERTVVKGASSYQQIFSERLGFIPNLSILDILFSEGPYTTQWLRDNKGLINTWYKP